jgi:hypothetical protein
VSPEFLDVVVWGQTCLFYAVRLQDDLLDGDISHSPLTLAPLLFLAEADRAYSSVFQANSGFWRHYRSALETTVSGIVRVAEMQRNSAVSPDALLTVYGGVDAILSVGSSAVCVCAERNDMIPRIDEFVGELGKVLLALDDVEDIEEDLADGRLNYAARMLLDSDDMRSTNPHYLMRGVSAKARPEGYDEIRRRLMDCLGRATDAIAPLELMPAVDLIEKTTAAVQGLGEKG